MWTKLLVAHDFSACGRRAVDAAQALAERTRASLTLLHVSRLPPNVPRDTLVCPPGAPAPVRIDELTARGAREQLERIAAPLRAEGLDVATVALVSDSEEVAKRILEFAEDAGVDVIVAGTHGRAGLARLLLGSTAEKLVRTARVPVVTVRPLETDEPSGDLDEERLAEDEASG